MITAPINLLPTATLDDAEQRWLVEDQRVLICDPNGRLVGILTNRTFVSARCRSASPSPSS